MPDPERTWTDTQLAASWLCLTMVQATPFCVGPHPFATTTAFVGALNQVAQTLDIAGSARLFLEALCDRMGYDLDKALLGLPEAACRREENPHA